MDRHLPEHVSDPFELAGGQADNIAPASGEPFQQSAAASPLPTIAAGESAHDMDAIPDASQVTLSAFDDTDFIPTALHSGGAERKTGKQGPGAMKG